VLVIFGTFFDVLMLNIVLVLLYLGPINTRTALKRTLGLVNSTKIFYKSLINSEKNQHVIKVTINLRLYLFFYNNKII